jgi:hypothetical protein
MGAQHGCSLNPILCGPGLAQKEKIKMSADDSERDQVVVRTILIFTMSALAGDAVYASLLFGGLARAERLPASLRPSVMSNL